MPDTRPSLFDQWLANRPPRNVVMKMDHATCEVYSALLVEEEGTASTFRALLEVLGRHGLPLSLYTDRGSQYFHAPADTQLRSPKYLNNLSSRTIGA